MAELDRIPAITTIPTTAATTCADVLQSTIGIVSSSPLPGKTTRTRVTRASAAQQKTKLIKIAPAPPNNSQKSFHV